MNDQLQSLWQRFIRRIHGRNAQCDALLDGGSVGEYCWKTRSHDGPHETGSGFLFFRWSDSAGREGAIALKPEVVSGENKEWLEVRGTFEPLGGKPISTSEGNYD